MDRLVWLALAALACGEAAAPADGPTPPPPDAPDDAPLADSDGLPPDLDACGPEQPCPDGTDCLRVIWLGGARRCLRRCADTQDCGLDEVCYHAVADPKYAVMANHCYLSICQSPLLACRLGAEIGLSAAQQRDGTCLPLDDQGAQQADDGGVSSGPIGQCLEAGTVIDDLPCDLHNRVRGGANCVQGSVCAGNPSTDNLGRCARLCDPLASPDPCAAAGRACFDASRGLTLRDPQTGQPFGQIHATWGYCRVGRRCAITVPGTCSPTQGCLPTNPVRSNGFCSDRGRGDRQVGQSCVPFGTVVPSQAERCQEALCDATDSDGGLDGICRAYCDPSHACAGAACVPYNWDEDANLTQGFGICR